MGYIYLIIAIIGEVVGTLSLKSSNGFTAITPSILVIVGYGVAFYFMILSMKTIPVAITYSIWSGVGIAAVTFIASMKFNEKPSLRNSSISLRNPFISSRCSSISLRYSRFP